MIDASKFSIVIPVYKEADIIERSLSDVANYLKNNGLEQTEVVVSVQESGDDSLSKAQSKSDLFNNFKVLDAGEQAGKGGNVKFGLEHSSGEYALFMDADLATPLHHIKDIFEIASQGSEVVIAIRNLSQTHKGLRKFISEFGNILVRVLLLPGIKDSQCGFKLFSRQAIDAIFPKLTILNWGFDMEVLKIAMIKNYEVKKIYANDWKDPKMVGFTGDSSVKVALQVFLDLLKIKWNQIKGVYK